MNYEEYPPQVSSALRTFLLSRADDEFMFGHRIGEWVGVGPTLEEDTTLASICQDEFGHGRLWYEAVARETESVDELAFNRNPADRFNTTLVEHPHTDYATLIASSYLYQTAEHLIVQSISRGDIDSLSNRADKILAEEPLHREHATKWLDRLVAGEEGRDRLTRAFETILPAATDLFQYDQATATLIADRGVIDAPLAELNKTWQHQVEDRLTELPLTVEFDFEQLSGEGVDTCGRRGEHTPALQSIVDDLHAGNVVGEFPVGADD